MSNWGQSEHGISQTGIKREQIQPDDNAACILIAGDDPDIVESLKSILQVQNQSY